MNISWHHFAVRSPKDMAEPLSLIEHSAPRHCANVISERVENLAVYSEQVREAALVFC
jgi:hypothetical protein